MRNVADETTRKKTHLPCNGVPPCKDDTVIAVGRQRGRLQGAGVWVWVWVWVCGCVGGGGGISNVAVMKMSTGF